MPSLTVAVHAGCRHFFHLHQLGATSWPAAAGHSSATTDDVVAIVSAITLLSIFNVTGSSGDLLLLLDVSTSNIDTHGTHVMLSHVVTTHSYDLH